MLHPITRALALAFLLSLSLTLGLIPAVHQFFPLVAFIFFVSNRKVAPKRKSPSLFLLCLVPCSIALLSGFFSQNPPWSLPAIAWYWFAIPLGEELLFRGWVYQIFESLFPSDVLTLMSPLPLSIVMSALCFSLWHFQNWGVDPLLWVLFQVLYTLFLGLWLGYLRRLKGSVLAPMTAHFFINVCGSLL